MFVYVAFVIDAYAGAIVGWEASASKHTRFVESALRQAAALRARQGHPIEDAIHHSDAGSQYTSVRFGETLSLSGLRPSVGSVGDAYDNALAETTIGLYKNECIRVDSPFRQGPLRTLGDVEYVTADYLAWFNQQRLMHRLGRVPPAEAEAQYYSEHVTDRPAGFPLRSWRLHLSCVRLDGSDSLVLVGRQQRRRAVPSFDVVEVLAPGDDDSAGLGAGAEMMPGQHLMLEGGEERLRGGVIGTTRPCPSTAQPRAGGTVS